MKLIYYHIYINYSYEVVQLDVYIEFNSLISLLHYNYPNSPVVSASKHIQKHGSSLSAMQF